MKFSVTWEWDGDWGVVRPISHPYLFIFLFFLSFWVHIECNNSLGITTLSNYVVHKTIIAIKCLIQFEVSLTPERLIDDIIVTISLGHNFPQYFSTTVKRR